MHPHTKAILVTGGIDSTTLMHMYADENPTLITVDYGQVVFPIQVDMITRHRAQLGLAPPVILKIDFPEWQKKPGLFQSGYSPDEDNPLEDWEQLRYDDFLIEGRNATMVMYALAYCSAHKIDELLAGYLYGEKEWEMRRTIKLMTGDNSPQFVDAMNGLTSMGLSHQVRFRTPFYETRWSKQDVIAAGKKRNINYENTYSCYFDPPCGVCDNCLLRKKYL